jgi:hypothetical protein
LTDTREKKVARDFRLMRWTALRSAALASTVLGLALLLTTGTAIADRQALDASKARWSAAGISDYRYGYRRFCECNPETPPETLVTVRDGRVIDVRHRPHGADFDVTAAEDSFQWYRTVPELFSLIESGMARDAIVRVRYDEELGYPLEIFIDYGPDQPVDETDLRITRLEPGSP